MTSESGSLQPTGMDKPEISVLYHLARTGGTLISKCLGCIEGNMLLSEVNPTYSVKHPLLQAQNWFNLFSLEEIQEKVVGNNLDYLASIKLISSKARETNQKLILRDWSHIDFTGVPFHDTPSYEFNQGRVLQSDFTVRQIASVRHPLDTYISLIRLEIIKNLTPDEYLPGCLAFARKASSIGFIRYEDFCHEPAKQLRRICQSLNVIYKDTFLLNYRTYSKLTGNVSNGRKSDNEIHLPRRTTIPEDIEGLSKNLKRTGKFSNFSAILMKTDNAVHLGI